MIKVRALASFEHSGSRRRGDQFHVSRQQADKLASKGLVELIDDPKNPPQAAGEPSSASPAAPASPLTTASLSATGGKKRGRPKKVPEASS